MTRVLNLVSLVIDTV